MSLVSESWLLSDRWLSRSIAWLSRRGFPPARWLCHALVVREVRAYEQRIADERIGAVLSACWESGRTVIGKEDEQGRFTVRIAGEASRG